MIHIVNAENRAIFAADLHAMHRQRKAVFVDGLGWNVPVQGEQEVDAYDRHGTIYLLAHDASGDLIGSARLLPTTSPHLMSDHFAHLCQKGVLHGVHTWEASRFCPSLALTHRQRLALLWRIFAAVMETSLLFGIDQAVFTANAALLPLALRAGWQAWCLGPTLPDGSDSVTAIAVEITLDGLRTLRSRFGIDGPVTRFIAPVRSLAA